MSNGGAHTGRRSRSQSQCRGRVLRHGSERVAAVTKTPTVPCEQDDNETVDNTKSVQTTGAQGKDIATELYSHGPSPLYDQRFARIGGIDEETSKAIADVRANNHTDAQGYLLEDGKDIGTAAIILPTTIQSSADCNPDKSLWMLFNSSASCEATIECMMIMFVVPWPSYRLIPPDTGYVTKRLN